MKELDSLRRLVRESVGCGADLDDGRKKRVSRAVVPAKSRVAAGPLGVMVTPLQVGEKARGREKEGSNGNAGEGEEKGAKTGIAGAPVAAGVVPPTATQVAADALSMKKVKEYGATVGGGPVPNILGQAQIKRKEGWKFTNENQVLMLVDQVQPRKNDLISEQGYNILELMGQAHFNLEQVATCFIILMGPDKFAVLPIKQ